MSLLACPVVLVLAGAALGAAGAAVLHRPIHPLELAVAAAISIAVGLLAVLPMVVMIGGGGLVLLRCATVANMARLVGIAIGGVLAVLWLPKDAHKMILILWLVAFYFLLLIGETIVSSWVMKHSRF
jgi:type IV secretory pathway protease TraF